MQMFHRKNGEEQPYWPAGPFKVRLPFVHYRWEFAEMVQALIMFVVSLAMIPLLEKYLGVPYDVALAYVVICGIGLGSLAGQLLVGGISMGSWAEPVLNMFNILPLMEVAEEGVPVTPPMVLRTNWVTLLVSYLFLAGVTAGTVVGLAWFTAKMEVQQVLRIGDA